MASAAASIDLRSMCAYNWMVVLIDFVAQVLLDNGQRHTGQHHPARAGVPQVMDARTQDRHRPSVMGLPPSSKEGQVRSTAGCQMRSWKPLPVDWSSCLGEEDHSSEYSSLSRHCLGDVDCANRPSSLAGRFGRRPGRRCVSRHE